MLAAWESQYRSRSVSAACSQSLAALGCEPTVSAHARSRETALQSAETVGPRGFAQCTVFPRQASWTHHRSLDSGWCFSSMLGLAASEWSMANGATVRGTGVRHTARPTRRNDAMRLFMRSIHKNAPQVDTIVVGADTVCFANPWKGRPFSPQAGRGTSHSTLDAVV